MQRIIQAIKHFNAKYDNQVNLSSDAAVEQLAQLIHDTIDNEHSNTGTYNEQQLELFSYNDSMKHK